MQAAGVEASLHWPANAFNLDLKRPSLEARNNSFFVLVWPWIYFKQRLPIPLNLYTVVL